MAVTIGEVTVETAPPAGKPPGQTAEGGAAAPKPADTKKEIEKTLRHHESRTRRLWAYCIAVARALLPAVSALLPTRSGTHPLRAY